MLCRLLRQALKHWLRHWYCAASGKLIAARHCQLLTATAVHALRDYAQQQQAKYARWRAASQHKKHTAFKAFRRFVADTALSQPLKVSNLHQVLCFDLSPVMFEAMVAGNGNLPSALFGSSSKHAKCHSRQLYSTGVHESAFLKLPFRMSRCNGTACIQIVVQVITTFVFCSEEASPLSQK